MDGCKPVLSETPKNMPNAHLKGTKGGIFEMKHEETKFPDSEAKSDIITKERSLSEAGELPEA